MPINLAPRFGRNGSAADRSHDLGHVGAGANDLPYYTLRFSGN